MLYIEDGNEYSLVRKKEGYRYLGIIVSDFKKLNNKDRKYVVENISLDCEGMLHIFNHEQLEFLEQKKHNLKIYYNKDNKDVYLDYKVTSLYRPNFNKYNKHNFITYQNFNKKYNANIFYSIESKNLFHLFNELNIFLNYNDYFKYSYINYKYLFKDFITNQITNYKYSNELINFINKNLPTINYIISP